MDIRTPPELQGIEADLDTLAAAGRGEAPATLEDRLFVATRGLLAAGSARETTPVVVRRAWLTRTRIAAAVAVAGTAGAVWMAQVRPQVSGAAGERLSLQNLEEDIDMLLAIKSDRVLSQTGDQIDALFLETATLGDLLLGRDWPSALFDEGAM